MSLAGKISGTVMVSLFAATAFGGNGAPTVDKPTFELPRQEFIAPIQTGTGRRAEVAGFGLYQVPKGVGDILDLGGKLPLLGGDMVFIRPVDNFYAGTNVVWTGSLRVDGKPAGLPAPDAQGLVDANGGFTGYFRAERDCQFQHNQARGLGPNWYFPKQFDIIGERVGPDGKKHPNSVTVTVNVQAPLSGKAAELRVGLSSNSPSGKENSLRISLNGAILAEKISWKGNGYRVITVPVDSSRLRDGGNAVELLGDKLYVKNLDFVEIRTPAAPSLRGGELVVATASGVKSQAFSLNKAKHAVDIADFRGEKLLAAEIAADKLLAPLEGGRLYYFAAAVRPLRFGSELRLAEPDIKGADYVAVGMPEMATPLAPLLTARSRAGLKTAFVPFDQLRDVYNGGLYGPGAIREMANRFNPKFLLLAGSFHRDCRGREEPRSKQGQFFPGIPAGLVHAEQLTVTDDIYALDRAVAVGRVPARTADELGNWVKKALIFKPSDNLLLLAGKNDRADFSKDQKGYLGKVPSALLLTEGMAPDSARGELLSLMRSGPNTVVYQGHGQSWELDKGLLKGADGKNIPLSSWLSATCNSAYYHADYEVCFRDWMFVPEGGCVNVMAAASIAKADQQNVLVGKFLQRLRTAPDITWGEMMNYLKRNLPFDEEMMEDKALPAFIRNSVPAERKCVEVYCLLGDPAMRIFPEKRRGVEIAISGQAKQSIPLPPGLVQAELRLNEEWGARPESLKNLHLQMCADNKPNDVWCDLPCPAAFAVGVNPVTIDTASLGYDGGAFALRALESRGSLPSTVWSEVKFRQANVYPPKPVVNFNRMYDYAKKGFALTLNVFPKDFVGDRKKVETKIQVGEKRGGAEPTLIKEIDFSLGFRHSLAGAYAKDGCFVRAKQRLNGKEGEWSDWKSLTEDNHGSFPKNAGVFFVRDNKRFSLGEGLFAIPTPLFFGDEAQFQVRDQRSQAVIADTGWTKDRFHRVNPADKAEIRARCRENGKILDWSPWKSSEQSKRKAASRRP